MRPVRGWLCILSALAAVACGGGYSRQIVIGPAASENRAELWERTLAAVSAEGYEPESVDPARGRIVVPSRVFGSRVPFAIQVYREGWIQIECTGIGPVSSRLKEEHIEFVIGLRERLGEES